MSLIEDELGGCLRSWRGRLSPAEAGLPVGSQRRVPGLRREEVAQLAGVSLDYLARLEQGRASSPSVLVLASLARALRLSADERSHLFTLARQAEPASGTIDRHITASLQRLLDRLADTPVLVVDAAAEIVAANPMAAALIGDMSGATRRERNLAWRHFAGLPSRVIRTESEHEASGAGWVGQLRVALARYPADHPLNALIADLHEVSPRFTELWDHHPVAGPPARRKTFLHPEVGEMTLDCDALTVQGSDLDVIVYTAAAGSADADALALLGAIGLQAF